MSTALSNKVVRVKKSDVSTPLKGGVLRRFKSQLGGGWKLAKGPRLEKEFKFPDFRRALAFTNRIGKVAEKQGHHPDIFLTYGEVRVQIATHRLKALTESDFILAARINKIS